MNLWSYAKMKTKIITVVLIIFIINTLVYAGESNLYKCASNNWINTDQISPAYTDEQRHQMAIDISNSNYSNIWPIHKDIKGRISVYFEICGSGFSIEEKKTIEQEISEAIKKILDNHF